MIEFFVGTELNDGSAKSLKVSFTCSEKKLSWSVTERQAGYRLAVILDSSFAENRIGVTWF